MIQPNDTTTAPTTARRILREAGDYDATKPLRDVLAHRRSHDELEPADWLDAIAAADGRIAAYLSLEADHEWWFALDSEPDEEDYTSPGDGPWQRWTTYPGGGWDHSTLSRGILEDNLGDVYGLHDADRDCEVYRSRVVPIEVAPEFVRAELGQTDPVHGGFRK